MPRLQHLQLQRWCLLPLFMACLLVFPQVSAGPAPSIGVVSLILGTHTAVDADGNTITLQRGSPLFRGYTITTGARGFVQANMNDGTRFLLGRNGEARLDDFDYQPAARTGRFTASIQRGGFEYTSGEMGKFNARTNHSTLRTPTALIGIRGTDLTGEAGEGETVLVLNEGQIDVADENGQNSVTLGPGAAVTVDTEGNTDVEPEASPETQAQVEGALPTDEEKQQAEETTSGVGTEGSEGEDDEEDGEEDGEDTGENTDADADADANQEAQADQRSIDADAAAAAADATTTFTTEQTASPSTVTP